jgi:hypothetical protein
VPAGQPRKIRGNREKLAIYAPCRHGTDRHDLRLAGREVRAEKPGTLSSLSVDLPASATDLVLNLAPDTPCWHDHDGTTLHVSQGQTAMMLK